VDGKGRVVVGRTLNDLIRYTQAHFAAEAKVLESCGYPDSLAHRSEHERLAYTVLEFYQKLMRNEVSMTAPTLHFLKDWLGAKILDGDRKFARFLKGRGLPWISAKNRARIFNYSQRLA
jgi:hemerythrin